MAKRTPDIGEIPPPSREARLKVAKLRKLSLQFLTTPNKMRRPSLLRATTSDSEGPSQRQIWLFRLAKFLLVLAFVYAPRGRPASSSTWAREDRFRGHAVGRRRRRGGGVRAAYKFTVAAAASSPLAVLVVTHGIGSYAAKLGGHKRHRDALMFVGAQDLSVLAALLLCLAATGPGGLSVDAKYGKGN